MIAPPDAVPAPAAVGGSLALLSGSQTQPDELMITTSADIRIPTPVQIASHSVTRSLGVWRYVALCVSVMHASERHSSGNSVEIRFRIAAPIERRRSLKRVRRAVEKTDLARLRRWLRRCGAP